MGNYPPGDVEDGALEAISINQIRAKESQCLFHY